MGVINKTEKRQNQTIKKDEIKSMKIEVQNFGVPSCCGIIFYKIKLK